MRCQSSHSGYSKISFGPPPSCRCAARRPLVCRLYPLGRTFDGEEERFALFEPEPGCEAVRGREGTIETFLESQDAGSYLKWARCYGDLFRRMVLLLERLESVGALDAPGEGESPEEAAASVHPHLSPWQDIDASLTEYCAVKGLAVPSGIEEAITLHIRAMEEWLDDLQSRAC